MKKKDETIRRANDSILDFYNENYLENRINEVIKAFLEDPTNEIDNNKISDLTNNKFNYLLSCPCIHPRLQRLVLAVNLIC